NPTYPASADQLRDLEAAVPKIGGRLFLARASNDIEFDEAFFMLLRERVGAFLVTSDPYFDTRRTLISKFAAQTQLPPFYKFQKYAFEGGLTTYGPTIPDAYRKVVISAARILKGKNPANLPVLQPIKFDFVVNLKTAKALGIEIPP